MHPHPKYLIRWEELLQAYLIKRLSLTETDKRNAPSDTVPNANGPNPLKNAFTTRRVEPLYHQFEPHLTSHPNRFVLLQASVWQIELMFKGFILHPFRTLEVIYAKLILRIQTEPHQFAVYRIFYQTASYIAAAVGKPHLPGLGNKILPN